MQHFIFICKMNILQTRRDQELRKTGDDDSEMSAESATNDSGRGGSEEDINSNRGNPMSDSGMKLRGTNSILSVAYSHPLSPDSEADTLLDWREG